MHSANTIDTLPWRRSLHDSSLVVIAQRCMLAVVPARQQIVRRVLRVHLLNGKAPDGWLGGVDLDPANAQDEAAVVEASPLEQSSGVVVRWLGGGVTEIATGDDKQIAYVDGWVWNNDRH